jgi:hypothetical protein
MKQEYEQKAKGEKQPGEEDIAIAAPGEEWQAIQQLITSYRQQSRAMKRFTLVLERLTRFQRRLTQATGWKSPDDYFI